MQEQQLQWSRLLNWHHLIHLPGDLISCSTPVGMSEIQTITACSAILLNHFLMQTYQLNKSNHPLDHHPNFLRYNSSTRAHGTLCLVYVQFPSCLEIIYAALILKDCFAIGGLKTDLPVVFLNLLRGSNLSVISSSQCAEPYLPFPSSVMLNSSIGNHRSEET